MDGWYKLAIHGMPLTDLILTLAPPTILLVLAVIFFRRKLHRDFLFFFIYVLYSVGAGVMLVAVAGRPTLYFWLYWITEALNAILALLVLREIFHRIFALPFAMYRWVRFLVPSTVVIILTIAIREMVYRPLGRGIVGRLVSAIYWFDVGVHALEGTILLLIVGLTLIFPVKWRSRQYELGILAGFGISAAVSMIADLLRLLRGNSYETFFRYGPPIAYVLATLIWLHVFTSPLQTLFQPQMDWDEMQGVMRRSRELLQWIKRIFGLRCHPLAPTV